MASHISLTVTFEASYVGDEYLPAETTAKETITLVIPNLEEKYVVLPKVLEGVTTSVISAHRDRVSNYMLKKQREEEKRAEYRRMGLWENGRDRETHALRDGGSPPVGEPEDASEPADDPEETGESWQGGAELEMEDGEEEEEEYIESNEEFWNELEAEAAPETDLAPDA